MPDLNVQIRGFVAGNNVEIHRIISNLPTTTILAEAILTIKRSIDEPDVAAVAQLTITTNVSDSGVIVNAGDGSGNAEIKFFLLPALTSKLTKIAVYDIELKTTDAPTQVYTPEKGTILAEQPVTLS